MTTSSMRASTLHALRGQGEDALRALAGEHLVEHDAEGVDVGARIGLAGVLLGGHVVGGAHDDIGPGEAAGGTGGGAGEAEVGELGAPILGEEDIGGLDVAVDDALAVRELQGIANLAGDGEGLLGIESGPAQDAAEVGAVHVFHDEIEVALAGLAEVVHGDDAAMLELGEGAGFALKAGEEIAVGGEFGGEELDGDGAIEGGLRAFVHGAHAAVAEEAFDPVLREQGGESLGSGRRPGGGAGGRLRGMQCAPTPCARAAR